jgi:benzoylformate decarboxylase
LPELTALSRERMSEAQQAQARRRLDAARSAIAAEREALHAKARAEAAKTPIRPLALWQALAEMLPRDTVVVEEALSSAPGLRQLLRSDDPQSFFGLRGGGIGWGLPAAIGVKLALPQRPVVALIGDGSAMYTCQALWTAAHDRVGVVFVILNNRSYRILKQRTSAMKGFAAQTDRYVGMDLTDPAIDYVGLARSLGLEAGRATTLADTVDLLRKFLAAGGPGLIEVELDRSYGPV